MDTMIDAYRDGVRRQMPDVPLTVIESLGTDYERQNPDEPYIAQTGGWVLTIACGTKMLTQEGEKFLVCEYELDEEGDIVYFGDDWESAWTVLNG